MLLTFDFLSLPMSNHLRAEIVQSAVLLNPRGEVLILRRPENLWQLPGGRLNEGEKWDEGLRREVFEETGIADLDILSIMMVDNWWWQTTPMYGVYFLCRTAETTVKLSPDHDMYRWVARGDDLSSLPFWHKSLQVLVERALAQSDFDYK